MGLGEVSFLPAVRVLLQGIAKQVIRRDPKDKSQVGIDIDQLSIPPDDNCTLPAVLAKAEAAVRALRDHTNRQARSHNQRFSEQQAAIRLLMGVLEDLSIAGPETMRRLLEINGQFEAALDAESLRRAKVDLVQCLDQVRREAERRIGTGNAQPSRDPVTNLPERKQAESALAEASISPDAVCVVVLLMYRFELYNRRYGKQVGDKALKFFASFVTSSFQSTNGLFRWEDHVLVLLQRGDAERIQAEGRRILEPKLKFEVETDARALLLPIDVHWAVFPMMVEPRLIINKIDCFVRDGSEGDWNGKSA